MKKAFLLVFLALVWSQAGTVSAVANGDIRLVGGTSSSSGRLEIYLDSQWGTVCYNKVSPGAAQAACQQLGLSDAKQVGTVTKMSLPPGTGTTHLSDVYCSPNSGNQHILRCDFSQTVSNSCTHSMDMAITCSTSPLSPYDTAVRLVNGGTGFLSSGIAEIYANDQWGTMCNYEILQYEASTICQQLGYTSSTSQSSAESSTKVWLGPINCYSGQECLDMCSGFIYPSTYYTPLCSQVGYSNVAVVNCTFDISEKDINLAGSKSLCTSYSYIKYNFAGIVAGALVGFIVLIILFIVVPIIICCCCIQGCLLHGMRQRRVYHVIQ